MIEIHLTQGRVAVVDECDARLTRFRWYALRSGNQWYAARTVRSGDGKRTNVRLGRVVMGVTDSAVEVEHVNGNGLDCRRENLIASTRGALRSATTRCRHCQKEIPALTARGYPRRVCSTRCGALSRPYPVEERFWAQVQKSEGCWEWRGHIATSGYGQISIHDRPHHTHRVSWELHHGPIAGGLWVLHHCDNRKCVRPDHLYLGTAKENARDMVLRGRHRWSRKGQGTLGEAA